MSLSFLFLKNYIYSFVYFHVHLFSLWVSLLLFVFKPLFTMFRYDMTFLCHISTILRHFYAKLSIPFSSNIQCSQGTRVRRTPTVSYPVEKNHFRNQNFRNQNSLFTKCRNFPFLQLFGLSSDVQFALKLALKLKQWISILVLCTKSTV